MPSEADSAFEIYGAPQLDNFCGVSVRFRRAGSLSEAFTAVFDQVMQEVFDSDTGLPGKVEMRDWVLPVASVVYLGEVVEPRSGDQIVMSTGEVYEILPAGRLPAVEKIGGDCRWKAHTKKVAVAS